MADTRDLKSLAKSLACGFESRLRHQMDANERKCKFCNSRVAPRREKG